MWYGGGNHHQKIWFYNLLSLSVLQNSKQGEYVSEGEDYSKLTNNFLYFFLVCLKISIIMLYLSCFSFTFLCSYKMMRQLNMNCSFTWFWCVIVEVQSLQYQWEGLLWIKNMLKTSVTNMCHIYRTTLTILYHNKQQTVIPFVDKKFQNLYNLSKYIHPTYFCTACLQKNSNNCWVYFPGWGLPVWSLFTASSHSPKACRLGELVALNCPYMSECYGCL